MPQELRQCICGNSVAPNAYSCPHCGNKFRSTPTNKFFKIVLIVIGLLIAIPAFFFLLFAIFIGMANVRDSNSNDANASISNTVNLVTPSVSPTPKKK